MRINNDDHIDTASNGNFDDDLFNDKFSLDKKNADLIVELEWCKQQIITLSQQILVELDHENEILGRYEALSNNYIQLEKKYRNLIKSPLVRLIYISWDIYNKIKYNKKPSFIFK